MTHAWDARMRNPIVNYLNLEMIQHWGSLVDECALNHWEGKALRSLLGDLRRLVEVRDSLDELRATFKPSKAGRSHPNGRQREELHDRTRTFMGAYYGAMSHLNAVVARHSAIFGRVKFTDVGPFIRWIPSNLAAIEHELVAELESARLFRALIEHPAQFPANDWGTFTTEERQIVTVMFWGTNSPAGKAPAGSAQRPAPIDHEPSDWHFAAPDELSLTNCVAHVAASLLARIVAARWPGAALRSAKTMHRNAVRAIGPWHPEFALLGMWEEVHAAAAVASAEGAEHANAYRYLDSVIRGL